MPTGWPVFWRVLAVMVACVLSVQMLNGLLLLVFRPPEPPIFTVQQVATAMIRPGDARTPFRVVVNAPPPTQEADPRATRLARTIAVAIGASADDVRVRLGRPPFPFRFVPRQRVDRRPPPGARTDLLIGDFRVSRREGDGSWTSFAPKENALASWRWSGLLGLLVALAAVVPFAVLLARWVARPITLFAAAAERLGRNPDMLPLKVDGPPEIADAAAAFNEMQQRLARYVEHRTMMLGAIAHDLRTPLMRLSIGLETLPESVRAGCEHNLAEMQDMLVAATAYVRDVTQTATRRRLDLRSIAESVVDTHADLGEQVSIEPGPPLVLEGDPGRLKSAIDNLIDNAVRYGASARVSLTTRDDTAILEVRDAGEGIAPDQLVRVFEPFYRIENSRNRATGGTGLGLSSARGVARTHGGDVTLENQSSGGVCARLTLPI
ncbi:sensor histidine kinase [Sphingomonas qomolangmaensis]|uniref:histidine kinase n=1 Tax=Sphingomonas qomolangmaensis TaxID=2918765 RepID=A0ABY5LBX1_9SPHN|nr:HAMP domain-containing sensor histidine kinase [Sphingomonas qomolangmaensis]UUL83163.1 HAMP domain-containing histidine kinase [Sphingomonas qomolangmaensis]